MAYALPAALDLADAREIAVAVEASHPAFAPAPAPTLRARRPQPTAQAAARRRAPPRLALGAACASALAMLVLGGRERIVSRIPAADRLFAAIGLPVNLAGVEFRNVVSKVTEIDGQKVLAVTGEVVNLRHATATPVPGLTLAARGADGRALYVWTAQAATAKLGPGETTSFRTRLAAPPDEARDVVVKLAEPAQAAPQAAAGAADKRATARK